MLISVIIPTYKTHHQMLERSIKSVLNQTYNDFEIIVVDDNEAGSEWKDEIKEYSEMADERVRFIFHSDNLGANAARNTGIENANGEVIAFLDSDDEWDETYLEEVSKAYMSGSFSLTSCDLIALFSDGTSRITSHTHEDGYIYNDLIFKDIVNQTSAVTVKKEALYKASLFDTALPARQDFDMWLRVCKFGSVKYIRKPLVTLHCDDSHQRISGNWRKREEGTKMVMNKLLESASSCGGVLQKYSLYTMNIWENYV